MAVREVLTVFEHPDLLQRVASEIEHGDPRLDEIISDLIDTNDAQNAVDIPKGKLHTGLAASELGHDARVILLFDDLENWRSSERICIVNPKIIQASSYTFDFWSGCGSVPGYVGMVPSPSSMEIAGFVDGKRLTRVLGGYAAGVAFHEINHLDGKTILTEGRPCLPRSDYEDLCRGKS